MSNPVFLSPSLQADEILLDGPEGRHAALVRRLRVGEAVDLVDGRGTRVTGTVSATTKDTITVAVSERVTEEQQVPRLTVVQALAKGDRGELAVELATEVGVDALIAWSAARCVVKWDKDAKGLERWRSTAREAAKQARRAWFPTVEGPLSTKQVAELPGQVLVLHENATEALSTVPLEDEIVLVVGPEGGISSEELTALGGTAVRLGPSVLRTSTAGAAAVAVISSRTGRW